MNPLPLIATVTLLLMSSMASAQWAVVNQRLEGTQAEAVTARIKNSSGQTLEFYRDGVGALRARFTLGGGLAGFDKGHCPTLQVDRWAPTNRSANDAACLATSQWVEYVIAYIVEQKAQSAPLVQIMNGSMLTFRYRLAGGDYRDAAFSLAGSKRSLTAAIGANVAVTAR